jgi:GGDEF domain-containing protein
MTEMEICNQERNAAVECYVTAIRNVAHYAIEFDDEATGPFRKYLTVVAGEAARADPVVLGETRSTVRGLLRDYRDKASHYLRDLREELGSTMRSLQEILDSLLESDGDHENRLRTTVGRLRQATDPDVLAAANAIEDSMEQVRKQHQFAVSQFLAEIRMLHKRIDSLERAASIDNLTKLLTRVEIEDHIRTIERADYGLLLVKLSGFRAAGVQYNREVAAELAGAFAKRLRNSLPANAAISRWSEEEFVALVAGMTNADAAANAKWVADHLSGPYACLQGGKSVRPMIELTVAIVNSEGQTAGRVLEQVEEFLTGVCVP